MYSALSRDQKNAIEATDDFLLDEFEAIQKLSQDKINLQKEFIDLGAIVDKETGKLAADAPIVHKLETAVKKLSKGDNKDFKLLMRRIPKDDRAMIVVSALDPLISSSTRGTGRATGIMADAGIALNRNKTAKEELFKYLTSEQQVRLDNLFTIADGIFTAAKSRNTSNTARDVLKGMDDNLAPVLKLINGGKRMIPMGVAPSTRMAAEGVDSAARAALNKQSDAATAADKLMSSKKFQNALDEYMKDNIFQGDATIAALPEFKAYYNKLPQEAQKEIGKSGFFNWMFRETDN